MGNDIRQQCDKNTMTCGSLLPHSTTQKNGFWSFTLNTWNPFQLYNRDWLPIFTRRCNDCSTWWLDASPSWSQWFVPSGSGVRTFSLFRTVAPRPAELLFPSRWSLFGLLCGSRLGCQQIGWPIHWEGVRTRGAQLFWWLDVHICIFYSSNMQLYSLQVANASNHNWYWCYTIILEPNITDLGSASINDGQEGLPRYFGGMNPSPDGHLLCKPTWLFRCLLWTEDWLGEFNYLLQYL